jgi:hypothetical protein
LLHSNHLHTAYHGHRSGQKRSRKSNSAPLGPSHAILVSRYCFIIILSCPNIIKSLALVQSHH